MGKKGKWLTSVKSALQSPIKEADDAEAEQQEEQEKPKQKGRRWSFGTPDEGEPEKRRDGGQHIDSAVLSNSNFAMYMNPSDEEWAAVVIQTAFRGYLARKSLRAVRGLVRLQSSGRGHRVSTTMQALVHMQGRIQTHRGLAAQHQMWQRGQPASRKALVGLTEVGWIDSTLSAQQIEAKVPERQVAALKRERALAYARTQQHVANGRRGSLQAMTPPLQARTGSKLNVHAGTMAHGSRPLNRQLRATSPQSRNTEELGSLAGSATTSEVARSMASVLTDPQFGTQYSNSGPARKGVIMDMEGKSPLLVAGHLPVTQSVKNKACSSQPCTGPGGAPPGALKTPATMKRLVYAKVDQHGNESVHAMVTSAKDGPGMSTSNFSCHLGRTGQRSGPKSGMLPSLRRYDI